MNGQWWARPMAWAGLWMAACLGCGSAGPYSYSPGTVATAPPPYSTASLQQAAYAPAYTSGPSFATTFGSPYAPFYSTPWTPQPGWGPQGYTPVATTAPSMPMLADQRSYNYSPYGTSSPVYASAPLAGLRPTPVDFPAANAAVPSPATTDVTQPGVPWPMPPRGGLTSSDAVRWRPGYASQSRSRARPLNITTHPGSRCAHHYRKRSGLPGGPVNSQLVDGAAPSPDQDLHYRGGKVIQNLSYVNLYVSGEEGWSSSDVANIDRAIAAAMNDSNLNNVIRQYFNNQPVTTRPLASHPLRGYRPQLVTRGDLQNYVQYLSSQGYFSRYDLTSTVFNFALPQGTMLTDGDDPGNTALAGKRPKAAADKDDDKPHGVIPDDEEGDSHGGLGGFHGSVHVNGTTVYFSVAVYSERQADGTANGIPVFAESWKNVVATMYHEMQEVRTDPDVEDAIRNSGSADASRYLGWTSNQGEEVGDFPLHDGVSLKDIIREVPLADGTGTVPIQLPYSNAVHGPEGPIPQPHPQPAR